MVGVLLFTFYSDNAMKPPAVMDKIYPAFIWSYLPAGLAGLVIAAILAAAMSNLSAALNAMASTTIMDFVKPLWPGFADAKLLKLAKWATLVWGVILFGIGLLARHVTSVLEAGLSIASILYGALLGVFLLGVLTKKPGEWAAIIGMSAGLVTTIILQRYVAYTWFVISGSLVTLGVGYLAGFVFPRSANAAASKS
jgi:Na+/proline symporter